MVSPKEWILPNRVYFNKWMYQTFHPSKYVVGDSQRRKNEPDPSQKLIRDFIQYENPYRGVLVYHGLGSGKSYTSILASESFVSHHSKVIVMTPASLEVNYRRELQKFSTTGELLKKKWTLVQVRTVEEMEVLKKMYGLSKSFIDSMNKAVWLPRVPKEFIADQLLSEPMFLREMTKTQLNEVQKVYDEFVRLRYTFIHYNGLTNKKLDELEKKDDYGKDLFDDALVIIDEVHLFISRVVNGGKIARRIYNHLISKPNLKLILLSGTPTINHPFELCSTLNLLRGPMVEYTWNLLKDAPFPSQTQVEDALHQQKILPFIDDIRLDEGNRQIKVTLVPNGFVKQSRDSIAVVKGPKIHDVSQWMTRSLNQLKPLLKVSAKYKTTDLNAFPDKKEAFMKLFMMEEPTLKINPNAMDLFMKRLSGIVSYYRIADENLFPTQLPTRYEKVPMSNPQFMYYVEKRMEEIKKDELQKKFKRPDNDPFKTNSSYRAFTRMACNYVFPEKIKRPLPSEIHARFLKREMDIQEDDDTEETNAVEKASVMKEYDRELQQALSQLQKEGDRYLQGDGLMNSSPKMARLLELLNVPGNNVKSLLYSQFRTVEGLKIFRMVLEQAGWKEIDFKPKPGGDWEIQNAEEILQPQYNGKRFLVFGDKQKTDLLIKLFNADLSAMPPTLLQQLKDAKQTENKRGDLASLLMITQSGAEGLNLKNVRKVYILEPFWNQVRIEQVIGRAIRKGSHLELPPEERNVEVTMFLSVFSSKQAKANKTIVFKDDSKTTDENIRTLAMRKDEVVQSFLNLLKANALDCAFNAKDNQPIKHGYSCFSYPINQSPKDLIYVPDIQEDQTNTRMFGKKERVRTVQGKAALVDGEKYVLLNNDPSVLYDYQAYKDAGVLIEKV